MKKITDLQKVKSLSKMLLRLPLGEIEGIPPELAVCHPFLSCGVAAVTDRDGNTRVSLLTKDDVSYRLWLENMDRQIDEAKSVMQIYCFVNKPYLLFFLSQIRNYLSLKDFSEFLGDAWVRSENGNNDPNVELHKIVRWFRSADKNALMDDKERKVFAELPATITVYRGVGKNRNPKGISWTQDFQLARWFANRFGSGGYIEKTTITKNDVLAYFMSRGESEVVVDLKALNHIEIMPE